MSKERIDLTQFEGIGEWGVEKQPDGNYAIKTGRDNSSLEEAETIAKLPDLLAELKKLYEFMDLHQICGCGAICRNMNKEAWARVKRCGFCESPK